jgi:hypothetical protein
MTSKWRKVDIYAQKLNFMTMSPSEVLTYAEKMTIPNKEKFISSLHTWEETFAMIDNRRKKYAENVDYIKFLDQNEQHNKELYQSVRTRLQHFYDREVAAREKLRRKKHEQRSSTPVAGSEEVIDFELVVQYPDFDSMTPHQIIEKLNEVTVTNKHYSDVQNVVNALIQFVNYFAKVEDLKEKHANDKKALKQIISSEKKNKDIFISNLVAAKQVYGIAMEIYIPTDEEAIRNDKNNTSHMFVDSDFPPSKTNINYAKKRAVAWRRPCQLVDDPQFIVDGISIDDIIQGTLGDCFFISSLACMTKSHLLEERCFVAQDIERGKYTFRFLKDGVEELVTIDDLLPLSVYGKMVSAHSKTKNEFWVALLEKAFAKLCGGYDQIGEGGSPADALAIICGGKKVGFEIEKDLHKADHVWKELTTLHTKGALLSCYAGGVNYESIDIHGIVHLHAYSILDIVEVNDNGHLIRLLKLRNPWGDKEWTGAYSDGDSHWTAELIQKLNVVFDNDGVFYIELHDFMTEFAAVEGVLH